MPDLSRHCVILRQNYRAIMPELLHHCIILRVIVSLYDLMPELLCHCRMCSIWFSGVVGRHLLRLMRNLF